MTSNDAVLKVAAALEAASIPYMLVGSYSSNMYGVARATQDADFVVQLAAPAIRELVTRLGPAFQLDPQMSFETVTATGRYVIELRDHPLKIELFLLSDDPHDQERFARRRQRPLLGHPVFVPSAEDVIITKLRWSQQGRRHKDVDDVRNVLAVQGEYLDWPYIHRWCDQHGTRALLDEICRSLPAI